MDARDRQLRTPANGTGRLDARRLFRGMNQASEKDQNDQGTHQAPAAPVRKGATAVQYGLIVALIAIVIISGVALIGNRLDLTFDEVAAYVASPDPVLKGQRDKSRHEDGDPHARAEVPRGSRGTAVECGLMIALIAMAIFGTVHLLGPTWMPCSTRSLTALV